MPASIPTTVFRAIQTQDALLPRQVLTQTITYADYTTTALVTLGPGGPTPAPRPPAAPASSQSSDILSGKDIGIIIGSILGAFVVALLIWMGCVIRRRVIDEEYRQYRIEQEESMTQYVVQRPLPTYWRFPRSITPPLVPTYTARPLPRRYTANRVAQDGTTSYIFWDDQGRT